MELLCVLRLGEHDHHDGGDDADGHELELKLLLSPAFHL
tara:strand:- start:159 stop:275 length:117 start_codon:yes stop_codon:yes gene_type:complete